MDIEQGISLQVRETAVENGSMLVREGCTGSPNCALEIYACSGDNYVGKDAVNLHFSPSELEDLYQAVKAVRKGWRKSHG